ncbi:MAG: sigma 54-interacting transcriptional regulator [Phycisphaerae bacterium]|nr:sigma 54-interacting transcriptional regulator [Phycisphaerae bacterium]
MAKILLTWLGVTDINSSKQDSGGNLGPIAGAVIDRKYKTVFILSDFAKPVSNKYKKWLKSTAKVTAIIRNVDLKDPMDFGSIYEFARQLVIDVCKEYIAEDIVFDLSPGTPAMAAVWIILGKTIFPQVELIESSMQDKKGNYHVRTTSVPFDISAAVIMDMLSNPDEKLKLMAQSLPPKTADFPEIIYKCKKMERVIAMARLAAVRNVPVLILGESGTGKELVAQAIHTESLRGNKKFGEINCGALSPSLVESELFGHVKGSFTGATKDKEGLFCVNKGGTLFLDEIGDLDLSLQVKLLRVIQEKKVVPVGSGDSCKVDVRIIAATHRDLMGDVANGKFREDLFYRLAVAVICIPPLRERGGDIDSLTDFFMAKINDEFGDEQPCYKGPKKISHNARIMLRNHQWPGNIRELQNTLMRAAIWSTGETIKKQDILNSIIQIRSKSDIDLLNQSLGPHFEIKNIVDIIVKHYFSRALKASGGNKTVASRLVGLPNHQTFTNWMKKHKVD